mgnify:CR=1 FL=1
MFNGRGTTTVRSRFARELKDANTDLVMAAVPIPPGGTITNIHMDQVVIGKTAISLKKAQEVSTHMFLVTDHKPDHGYGDGIQAYDTMWDDVIPKDVAPEFHLDNMPGDSFASSDSQEASGIDEGAIESGIETETGGGGVDLAAVLNAGAGPELLFSRVKRLDVTNGIISESGKFTPIDKVVTSIRRNIAVPQDRYGWLMAGVGNPQFDVANSYKDGAHFDTQYLNDIFWQSLAHPEVAILSELMLPTSDSNPLVYSDHLVRGLELAYIDADTYHDLSDGDGDGSDWYVVYNALSVTYKRPSWDQLHLTSRRTA